MTGRIGRVPPSGHRLVDGRIHPDGGVVLFGGASEHVAGLANRVGDGEPDVGTVEVTGDHELRRGGTGQPFARSLSEQRADRAAAVRKVLVEAGIKALETNRMAANVLAWYATVLAKGRAPRYVWKPELERREQHDGAVTHRWVVEPPRLRAGLRSVTSVTRMPPTLPPAFQEFP